MEKNRQTKVIAIIALVVAVIGMSVGFAAFSNTLIISSSATVTPNEEDFIIKVYGIESELAKGTDIVPEIFTSDIVSVPIKYDGASGNNATINNADFKLSNLSASFVEPGQSVTYAFMIKNEGEYDAYMSLNITESSQDKICTPGTGSTTSLVEAACEEISLAISIKNTSLEDISNSVVSGSYKIEKDSYVYLTVDINYSGDIAAARADGPFTITFGDIAFDFSTAA